MLQTKPKPCKNCGSTYHYTFACPWHKKKRIVGPGKTYERWLATRAAWFKQYGYEHPCHYCGAFLHKGNITLDHLIPRSRAPHLRYEFSNLVPCCWRCNTLKGSVAHDDYKHTCHT